MGFDHKHYVPILKAKAGELRALREAAGAVRTGMTPVLEIQDIPPKWIEGEEDPVPSKSIDAHVKSVSDNIVKNWGTERRVFIDGVGVEQDENLEDGREPIAAMLDMLRDGGVKAIPVAGIDRLAEYNTAVRDAAAEDGRGVCLRLTEDDLEADDLDGQIKALRKFLKVSTGKIDLLVDFGGQVPPKSTLVPLLNALPELDEWRSLTLSACAFPPDMSNVGQFSTEELSREEWLNWTHARSRIDKLKRMPTYSDYGINYPSVGEMDPRQMRMSANIRYTWATAFVVAKGEALPRTKDKTKKQPAKQQYPALAKAIMKHPAWCGPLFSWGDAFIAKCANGDCVGNGTDWRAVGTSHHLAYVVQQIANLP